MSENKKYAAVGGQAVMEGILMRSPKRSVMAVRDPKGEIVKENMNYTPLKEKYKIFGVPIIRGIVSFIESMIVGYMALMRSAELSGLEEETKGNKVLEMFLLVCSMVLGIGLAVIIFLVVPQFCVTLIEKLIDLGYFRALVEGIIRMIIFIIYILLVSKMNDIKRLFQYHGAEHKTIFCLEAEEELTVENVKTKSRLHPRCGTSFIFLVMAISILFFSFVSSKDPWVRILLKFLLLPAISGVSYEVLRFTGQHNNSFTRFIAAPGKALQKITTAEPDDSQIEVAIAAMKASLEDDGEVNYKDAYAE